MEKLKAIREARQWTQATLAEKVGVTSTTISLWERGEVKPISRITLRRLRRVLGLTAQEMVELFKEEGNANK